jgi:hypothetical protein
MYMTKRAKLLKEQWDQLTHEEKRALAKEQLAVGLATSKIIARQQTQDEVAAARKWHEDAPMREGYKEYAAARRRLKRG